MFGRVTASQKTSFKIICLNLKDHSSSMSGFCREWCLEVGSKDSILLCSPVLSLEVFEGSLTLWKRTNKAKQMGSTQSQTESGNQKALPNSHKNHTGRQGVKKVLEVKGVSWFLKMPMVSHWGGRGSGLKQSH